MVEGREDAGGVVRLTGISEQYDSGRLVVVERSAAHVLIGVEAGQDEGQGTAYLTPGQARALAAMLGQAADLADEIEWGQDS